MNTGPSWDLYRTFAAVMRDGSLSAAARSLGIAQPSVSRHIDELERALGTTLFVRSQRGFSPTDRALALLPYAEDLIATSAALLRAASASPDEISGVVRISASEIVAVEHLPPIIAALRRTHPGIAVELAPSNALDDLLARRADIAVRNAGLPIGTAGARPHWSGSVIAIRARRPGRAAGHGSAGLRSACR